MNFMIPKIKNTIIKSVSYSFITGFCVGCFPNGLMIKIEDKPYKYVQLPLLSGLICSTGVLFSPFLMINYFCEGVYFDKLIDKYDINIKRYHQYDGKNNKYAFPSVLILTIHSKKE